MLRILRSLGRTSNVFLTKMNTLLPDLISLNILPELLLLFKGHTVIIPAITDALLHHTISRNILPELLLLFKATQ